jgi:hypothetical protein
VPSKAPAVAPKREEQRQRERRQGARQMPTMRAQELRSGEGNRARSEGKPLERNGKRLCNER